MNVIWNMVCCFAEVEGESMLGDGAAIEMRSQLSRLQRQMIALLPKYCLSDSLLKQVSAEH
jgi:hypothetical protein